MTPQTVIVPVLALALALSIPPEAWGHTTCGTSSARIAGPTSATGCGASQAEAKANAQQAWDAQALSILINAGYGCAECASPNECRGTVNYTTTGFNISDYTTSSGSICCLISTPNHQIQMSCTPCN